MNRGHENVIVNDGTVDREITVNNGGSISTGNESTVNVQKLERYFNERIEREVGNIVDTVEDRIQNAILTAIDNTISSKIELAVKSTNASSGLDAACVTAKLERGERIVDTAPFENVCEKKTIHSMKLTRTMRLEEISQTK